MSKVPRETLIGVLAVIGCGFLATGISILTSTGWTLLAYGAMALIWAFLLARSGSRSGQGEKP